jgi:xanthine/uracil/vitamin C permease (AzgA family)
MWLCSSDPAILNIPYRAELVQIFPAAACENEIEWIAASDTFPRFVQLLAFTPFTYSVLLGLVVSVGGLTESLVRVNSSVYLKLLFQDQVDVVRMWLACMWGVPRLYVDQRTSTNKQCFL